MSGLLLSLAIHAMLLTLVFGGQGYGLVGLGLPWQDRRTEPPAMRAILLPAALPAAEPAKLRLIQFADHTKLVAVASVAQLTPEKVSSEKTSAASSFTPAISSSSAGRQNQASAPQPKPTEQLIAVAKSDQPVWIAPAAPEVPVAPSPVASPAVAKQEAQRRDGQAETERQENAEKVAIQQQELVRQETVRAEALRAEAERQEFAKQAVERQESSRQDLARAEAAKAEAAKAEAAKAEAAKAEAAKAEAAKAEAAKAEAAKAEAAKAETARAEAAKVEAAKAEAAKVEAAKVEAARAEAARAETARAETARAETARAETARAEAQRQEYAKRAAAEQEAARVASARQEAMRIEAARLAALQAEAEKRQEKLRAIGRQLAEEAARREAAAAPPQLPLTSGLRRGRLLGRTDPNAELVRYAQAWSRKIELNMTFDMIREAVKQAHTDPMVTVAVRSDGSVESVSFVVSSGVPAIDDAIRRIIYSQANYQAFPPALTKDFDVIEIRRTWYFDVAIRLY